MQSLAVLTRTYDAFSNTRFCESLADEILDSHFWMSPPRMDFRPDADTTANRLPISSVNIPVASDNRFQVSPDAPDMAGGIPWVRMVEHRKSMSRTVSFSAVNRLRDAESTLRNRKLAPPVSTPVPSDPTSLLTLVEESNQRQSQKLAAIVESQTGRRKKSLFALSLNPLPVMLSKLFQSWQQFISQNQAISTYIAGFRTS